MTVQETFCKHLKHRILYWRLLPSCVDEQHLYQQLRLELTSESSQSASMAVLGRFKTSHAICAVWMHRLKGDVTTFAMPKACSICILFRACGQQEP